MKKIAHRGNTNGPSIYENQAWFIEQAINKGFDAEVDVWKVGNSLWLGHDAALFLTNQEFFDKNKDSLWIHCKNFAALNHFAQFGSEYNYFWHDSDDYTITSKGFLWTYPGKQVGNKSVIVDLEGKTEYNCYAICSDYFPKEE